MQKNEIWLKKRRNEGEEKQTMVQRRVFQLIVFLFLMGIQVPLQGYVRIVKMDDFPEPEAVQLTLVFPEKEALVKRNPVFTQIRLRGFSLGTDSLFGRKLGIANSPLGQTLRIVVDDKPYYPFNGPSIDAYDDDGNFFESNYKFELPYTLDAGLHTVRVFPCRSYGESLKSDQVFEARAFYVGDKGNFPIHLYMPYLTYNEPSNQTRLEEGKPILLDFLISNCELSPDGYKVRVEIDGKESAKLADWRPYFIYGLSKGKHEVRLTLIDRKNKLVHGPFNDITRIIYVL